MALVKIIPVGTTYKGRFISMTPEGGFLISNELVDEIKHIERVGITFYQDSITPVDWYLCFETDGFIPIHFKKNHTTEFNAKAISIKILKSIGIDRIYARVRVVVGKTMVKDGINVYPLVTASIKKQLV